MAEHYIFIFNRVYRTAIKGKASEMTAAASTAGCKAYQFADTSSNTEPLIIKAAE